MIRRLSARETKIMIATAAAVVAAGVFHMIYFPLQDQKLSLNERIMATRLQMDLDHAVLKKASIIDAQYQNYLRRLALAGTQEEAVASILKDIEGIIRELNLDVGDLKPGPVKDEGTHYKFAISLSLNGDLPGLVQFLYALQQEPHYYEVDEIQIEKLTRQNDPGLKTRLALSKVFVLSESKRQKDK